MLVPARVRHALDQQREAFLRAAQASSQLEERLRRALDELSLLNLNDLLARLDVEAWPGARPTAEFSKHGLFVPFAPGWESARDARSWAVNHLRGITTVAVDGSQIAASKEFGVPISLAQVAWFENRHDPERPYVKDVCNEVITPGDSVEDIEEYAFAESKLNQRRFSLEMRVAVERIRALATETPTRGLPPLVLIDGSFVLSFIGRMAPQARSAYLDALFEVLEVSKECRIPVIGYVDLSYASDLVTMLHILFDLPVGPLFDARILASTMEPLDRTIAFQCARGDVLPYYQTSGRDLSREFFFVYLKTGGAGRLPARIDFPQWILDDDLLDHVIDVIRAEVVVGSGYPYALETADAAAVLTTQDRISFYKLFHDFAHSSGLDAALPGKSISKRHRR